MSTMSCNRTKPASSAGVQYMSWCCWTCKRCLMCMYVLRIMHVYADLHAFVTYLFLGLYNTLCYRCAHTCQSFVCIHISTLPHEFLDHNEPHFKLVDYNFNGNFWSMGYQYDLKRCQYNFYNADKGISCSSSWHHLFASNNFPSCVESKCCDNVSTLCVMNIPLATWNICDQELCVIEIDDSYFYQLKLYYNLALNSS